MNGGSKNMKRPNAHPEPDEMTAPFRVASKGVYADGGSITERRHLCKFVAPLF
jgi:hypothetical protein